MSVDSIWHRRLRPESTFAFSGQAARFRSKTVEPHEIEESPDCGERPYPGWMMVAENDYHAANCIRNARSADEPHTTKQHQAAEGKEHHGQTTTLLNDRESISLVGRGTPDRAVSARQVHAAHSSWDDARRRDDGPYFLWHRHPCTYGHACPLAHYPSRRADEIASRLAAADIGGGALAALCARASDHDDGLDLCIRARLVDLAVLCPSPNVADRRLAARKCDRQMARHDGMGAALGDQRPRGGRDGAYVHFPRPDHAAYAAGEADGRADQEPEVRGRSDEARRAIAGRLMIRVAEPGARSDLA
jgi:hypothetical protein